MKKLSLIISLLYIASFINCNMLNAEKNNNTKYDIVEGKELFLWLPKGIPSANDINLHIDRNFVPSGSRWAEGLNERQVFHVSLTANKAKWSVRIGKGGQIYSLRGPFGESIPPQRPGLSEWNDEVWQLVTVATQWQRYTKDTGWPWFLHGSGTYRRDPAKQTTFYGPIVAEYYDAENNAYNILTWPQQPNLPTPFRSKNFFITRLRAIDAFTIEITYAVHNWGEEPIDYIEVPWGGVRASRFPERLIDMKKNPLCLLPVHSNKQQTG